MSDPGVRRGTKEPNSTIPTIRTTSSGDSRAHWISGASAAAVAILLMLPTPPGALPLAGAWSFLPPLDKVVHFVLFFAAAWPWWRSFRALGLVRPGLARVATVSFATAYAGLLELAQGALTTTRTAEWGDLLAGALGAAVGVVTLGAARSARRASTRAGGHS
jgi:hypothetical protein